MHNKKIVEQDATIKLLTNELVDQRLTGSYLFTGPKSVGKYTVARLLVDKIFNPKDSESTRERLRRHLHPDLLELKPIKNLLTIENTREALNFLQYAPLETERRVVIIDDAECMNTHASNSLLKTLEEPPNFAIIILISSRPWALLPTIVSRCKRVRFKPLSTTKRSELLNITRDAAEIIGYLGGTDWSDKNSVVDNAEQTSRKRDNLLNLLSPLFEKDDQDMQNAKAPHFWKLGNYMLEDEDDLVLRIKLLQSIWRDMLFIKSEVDDEYLIHRQKKANLLKMSQALDVESIEKVWHETEVLLRNMVKGYANKKITIDKLLSSLEVAA